MSILSSRAMELIALWIGEFIMAFVCRLMIWGLLWAAHHFKNKKQYTDELVLLFYITIVFDTGIAVALRGFLDLYSWLTVYLSTLFITYLSNREFVDSLFGRIPPLIFLTLQQQPQQQESSAV